jgi:hypothetical protein
VNSYIFDELVACYSSGLDTRIERASNLMVDHIALQVTPLLLLAASLLAQGQMMLPRLAW